MDNGFNYSLPAHLLFIIILRKSQASTQIVKLVDPNSWNFKILGIFNELSEMA